MIQLCLLGQPIRPARGPSLNLCGQLTCPSALFTSARVAHLSKLNSRVRQPNRAPVLGGPQAGAPEEQIKHTLDSSVNKPRALLGADGADLGRAPGAGRQARRIDQFDPGAIHAHESD